jgi:hypothetical protein
MKKGWQVWHKGVKSLIYKKNLAKRSVALLWHKTGNCHTFHNVKCFMTIFTKKITETCVCSGARPPHPGGLQNGVSLC